MPSSAPSGLTTAQSSVEARLLPTLTTSPASSRLPDQSQPPETTGTAETAPLPDISATVTVTVTTAVDPCLQVEALDPNAPETLAIANDRGKDSGIPLTLDSIAFAYRVPGWVVIATDFVEADGEGVAFMQLTADGHYIEVANTSGVFLPLGEQEYRKLILGQNSDVPQALLDCAVHIDPTAGSPIWDTFPSPSP